MTQIDPLRDFRPRTKIRDVAPQEAPQETADSDGVSSIRHFFEDDAVDNIYSKENGGSESYIVTGQPCHGGYEESDDEKKP